jgi:L-iditol 2-dehydrogenase
MGMLHIMLARRLGAELIIGADRVPSRLARAKEVGAGAVVDVSREHLSDAVRSHTEGEGADVVIVGPGTLEAIEMGYRAVASGGTLLLFTPTPSDQRWSLPVHDAYFREVRIVPSFSTGPAQTKEALRWLMEGLPVDRLITHRLPLERAIDGYRLVLEAADALKVVVYP